MLNYLIFGTILALTAFIVYITRIWRKDTSALSQALEKEKATQEEVSRVALERAAALEKEKLTREYETRKKEQERLDALDHDDDFGTELFYPGLHKDPNKDGLN